MGFGLFDPFFYFRGRELVSKSIALSTEKVEFSLL